MRGWCKGVWGPNTATRTETGRVSDRHAGEDEGAVRTQAKAVRELTSNVNQILGGVKRPQ